MAKFCRGVANFARDYPISIIPGRGILSKDPKNLEESWDSLENDIIGRRQPRRIDQSVREARVDDRAIN